MPAVPAMPAVFVGPAVDAAPSVSAPAVPSAPAAPVARHTYSRMIRRNVLFSRRFLDLMYFATSSC